MADFSKNTGNDCMDWNAALNSDGKETSLLPEGDYTYEVEELKRGRFPGSKKIPACNMAKLTLRIKTESGSTRIHCNLILHRSLEWKLSSFFCSIGLKKKGEPFTMDWSRVPGSHGRAHIIQRTFVGKDGRDRTINDVDKFLDYNPADNTADQFMDVDDSEPLEWD